MMDRADKLIRNEWKASLFFVSVILFLGSMSIYVLERTIFKIILLFIGLCVYNAYFLYLGKALKGEKLPNPYKFILIGKDRARYDFFVLLAFFSAILMLFYGPYAVFQALFLQKFNDFIKSIGLWAIFFQFALVVFFAIYKTSLYSAVSSLTYHRHEVLEAFKNGMKGIWRFKGFLAFLAAYEIAVSILLGMTRGAIQNGVTLISYVMPAAIMFLMSCSYSLAESPLPAEAEPVDNKKSIPDKGMA